MKCNVEYDKDRLGHYIVLIDGDRAAALFVSDVALRDDHTTPMMLEAVATLYKKFEAKNVQEMQ